MKGFEYEIFGRKISPEAYRRLKKFVPGKYRGVRCL